MPVIVNRAAFDPRHSDDASLLMNTLLELLAKEVRTRYASTDLRFRDGVAWMLNGLGKLKQLQYILRLEEVRANARDGKIRKYAQVSLDYYK